MQGEEGRQGSITPSPPPLQPPSAPLNVQEQGYAAAFLSSSPPLPPHSTHRCCVQCNQCILDVQCEEGRQHLGERDASLVCTLQIGSCSDGPTTNKISRVPEHTSASMVCTQKVESCVSAGGLQVIEGRDEIDVPRHAMFCMFG